MPTMPTTANAIQMRVKTMDLDTWLSLFEWLSIGAGIVAVAALIGTAVVGKKVNALQA
jgi:hypothetical protein